MLKSYKSIKTLPAKIFNKFKKALPKRQYRKFLKNLGVTTAIALALITSLKGRKVPIDKDMYQKAEVFTIRPYKYGIYLTQRPYGIFYNVSPQYIYYYTYGTKRSLIPYELDTRSEESFLRYKNDSLISKFYGIQSYFGTIKPTATFPTKQGNIKFQAEVAENTVKTTIIQIPTELTSKTMTMGLTINETDEITEEDQYITISNPKTSGIVRLDKTLPHIKEVRINRDNYVIELDVSMDNLFVVVETFSSIKHLEQT